MPSRHEHELQFLEDPCDIDEVEFDDDSIEALLMSELETEGGSDLPDARIESLAPEQRSRPRKKPVSLIRINNVTIGYDNRYKRLIFEVGDTRFQVPLISFFRELAIPERDAQLVNKSYTDQYSVMAKRTQVINPATFKKRMMEIATTKDYFEGHEAADIQMGRLLTALGYGEGVAVFEAMDRQYDLPDPWLWREYEPFYERQVIMRRLFDFRMRDPKRYQQLWRKYSMTLDRLLDDERNRVMAVTVINRITRRDIHADRIRLQIRAKSINHAERMRRWRKIANDNMRNAWRKLRWITKYTYYDNHCLPDDPEVIAFREKYKTLIYSIETGRDKQLADLLDAIENNRGWACIAKEWELEEFPWLEMFIVEDRLRRHSEAQEKTQPPE